MGNLCKRFTVFLAVWAALNPLIAEECNPSTLELNTAIEWAYAYSPELKKYETSISIREAEGWQYSLWPNPEFTLVVDDFGGSKRYAGWRSGELQYFLSQLFELGGKRGTKVKIAAINRQIEYWNWETKKRNIYHKILHAFIDIATANETLQILDEIQQIENRRLECLTTLVNEGKMLLSIHKKAVIDLSLLNALYTRKQKEVERLRRKLSIYWGSLEPEFMDVDYNLFSTAPLPPIEDLEQYLCSNPAYLIQQLEIVKRQEEVALAKAYAIPDVILTAGYKSRHNPNAHAFEVDVTIPIPVFNRNQGAICQARLLTRQAELELDEIDLHLREQLKVEYINWDAIYQEAEMISATLLPNALSMLEEIKTAHRGGKTPCFDLFDAQKMALDLKQKYIDALNAIHHQRVIVMEIAGLCECFEEF